MVTRVFTPATLEYARLLQADGFIVYQPADTNAPPLPISGVSWFHYSRVLNGKTCFGTVTVESRDSDNIGHRMPIEPSRTDGSAIIIRLDDLSPHERPDEFSVMMALFVARPTNFGRHFTSTKLFENVMPWGIGGQYLPLPLPGNPE